MTVSSGPIAPYDERASQRAVEELNVLQTPRDERIDRITRIAQEMFDVPMVSVTLLDGDRQWRKSEIGLGGREAPREDAFCDFTVREGRTVVVPDATQDPRWARNPFVEGDPHLRFYAGHPLSARGGERIGTLCILDTKPRHLDARQERMLRDLSGWVQSEIVAERELDDAVVVQRALLPRSVPDVPGYELAAAAVAAGHVMGDFHDWYPASGGVRMTVADVMGKGLGAAILAAGIRSSLRALRDRDLLSSVTEAERQLESDASALGTFATLFHAELDAASGVLSFVDAGHSLAFILRSDDTWEHLRSSGMPLGMGFAEHRTVGRAVLDREDILLICSDGLLDVLDETDPFEHVRRVVRHHDLKDSVGEAIRLSQSSVAPDDVTVVAIRRIA